MKKKFLAIFLVIILAVTNTTVCYADGLGDLSNINLNNYEDGLNESVSPYNSGNAFGKDSGQFNETVTGIMKVIINMLTFIPKLIVNVLLELIGLIIPTMDKIIFNDNISLWGGFFRLSYFDTNQIGLAGEMVKFVSAMYQAFRYIALIGFVVAIACIAVKMILSSVGKQKAQYKDALKNWLVGLVLLVVGHWIMIYAIYFSDFLVNVLVSVKEGFETGMLALQNGGNASFDLTATFSAAVGANGASAYYPPLGILWACVAIIAIIVFVAMNLKVAKVYLERVIIVGVLIMIFPLVTVFYAFEKSGIKKGATFESWLRTFIEQVFIQPIHALTLIGVSIALFAMSNLTITAIPIIGMIFVLMVLNSMFTIENFVKRVFAINGASLGNPVNPVGAAIAGAGMAVPVMRDMGKNAKSARIAAKDAGKGFLGRGWAGVKAGWKSLPSSTKDFAFTGKYGKRNAQMLAGMAGFSIPDEIFNVDRLSQKEQKDAVKRVKKASATVNISTVSGNGLHDDVKNLEHMMDPEVLVDIRRKCGVDGKMIKDATLNGNVSNPVAMRKYMQMLADPTVDVSGLSDDEFDYYTSTTDNTIKRDMEKGAKLTGTSKVPDGTKKARKVYMLKHADQADTYMNELGLDEAKIAAVEAGTASDNDALAYELFLRKCEGLDIDVADCKDASTGDFDADIVHNIDMSDSKMQKNFKAGRNVSKGSVVDQTLVTSRKVYAAKNRKKAEKIQRESGLSEATIHAIEIGDNSVSDDDILSYKIMVDRLGTEQDLDTYMDTSGNMSEAIYNGVTMESADIHSQAASLVSSMPDVVNDSAANYQARSVLAGFRKMDENKLARCANSIGNNVNINDINAFIDGGTLPAGCDAAQILSVIEQYVITK